MENNPSQGTPDVARDNEGNLVVLDHVTILKDATVIVVTRPQGFEDIDYEGNDKPSNDNYTKQVQEAGDVHTTLRNNNSTANIKQISKNVDLSENIEHDTINSSKLTDQSHIHANNDNHVSSTLPGDDIQKKEREDRIRAARERQASEYRRKVGEMQEAMTHAQEVRKKQEQERRRRMEEMKKREDEHRLLVEERRKKLLDEENERRQAIMKRAAERYSKLNHLRSKRTYVWPGMYSSHGTGFGGVRSVDSSDNSISVSIATSISDSLSHQRSVSTGNVGHYTNTLPLGGRGRTNDDKRKGCRSESLLSSPSGTPTRRPHSVTGGRAPTDSMTNSFMMGRLPNYASPTVASQLRDGRTSEPHCHVGCSRYRSISPEHVTTKNHSDVKRATDQWSIGYRHPDQSGGSKLLNTSSDVSHSKRPAVESCFARTPDSRTNPESTSRKKRARASSTPVKLRASLRAASPSRAHRGVSQTPIPQTSGAGKVKRTSPENKVFSSTKLVHSVPANQRATITPRSVDGSMSFNTPRSMEGSMSFKSVDETNTAAVGSTRVTSRANFVPSAAQTSRVGVAGVSGDSSSKMSSSKETPTVPGRLSHSVPKEAKLVQAESGKSSKLSVETKKKHTSQEQPAETASVKTNDSASVVGVSSTASDRNPAVKSKRQTNEVSTFVPSTASSDAAKSQEEEYKQKLAEKRRLARERADLAAAGDARKKEQDEELRQINVDQSILEAKKEHQFPGASVKVAVTMEADTLVSVITITGTDVNSFPAGPENVDHHFDSNLADFEAEGLPSGIVTVGDEVTQDTNVVLLPSQKGSRKSQPLREGGDNFRSQGNGSDIKADLLQADPSNSSLSKSDVLEVDAESINAVEETEVQSSLAASKLETERNLKLEMEEKARLERAEKAKKEEDERLERKKRLEMIMKRVKPDDNSSKNDIAISNQSSFVKSNSGADIFVMTPGDDVAAPPAAPVTESSLFRSPLLKQMMNGKGRVASPLQNNEKRLIASPFDEIESTPALDSNVSQSSVELLGDVEQNSESSSLSKTSFVDGRGSGDESTNLSLNAEVMDSLKEEVGNELVHVSKNSTGIQSAMDNGHPNHGEFIDDNALDDTTSMLDLSQNIVSEDVTKKKKVPTATLR